MRLLLKYPTRSRPVLFFQTIRRWTDYLSGENPWRWAVSCDADDPAMSALPLADKLDPRCDVHFNPPPQTKVSAVNANVPASGWDLLIVVSDDMLPERPGYDAKIVELYRRHFPDGDGLLHLNDGRAGAALCTLPVMDAKYYQRDGYVYRDALRFPGDGYVSVYPDDEQTEVAKRRGRHAYVDEVIVRHHWTDATGRDALHLRNEAEATYAADRLVFERRRAEGFPA